MGGKGTHLILHTVSFFFYVTTKKVFCPSVKTTSIFRIIDHQAKPA